MIPTYTDEALTVYHGHCLDVLRTLPEQSVQCCVTSPPYWGLRDYGIEPDIWGGRQDCQHEWGEVGSRHRGGPHGEGGQCGSRDHSARDATADVATGSFCTLCGAWRGCHGLEPTPELYVQHAVEIFREVRRVLRDDGTLWLNLGDTYATGAGKVGKCPGGGKQGEKWYGKHEPLMEAMGPRCQPNRMPIPGLKPKDLVGIPWRVAFALQADGWYLRQDIIFHKPNPMPESVTDRCTKAHEYIFLLSKSERYYYDAKAIREPVTGTAHPRGNGITPKATIKVSNGWDTDPGVHGSFHRNGRGNGNRYKVKNNESFEKAVCNLVEERNKRSVWTVPTFPYPDAHFATFPPDLIKPCILAGAPPGAIVIDPFYGSGTTGMVSKNLNRRCIGIDRKMEYIQMSKERTAQGVMQLYG